jgi:hypothetical protein
MAHHKLSLIASVSAPSEADFLWLFLGRTSEKCEKVRKMWGQVKEETSHHGAFQR